MKLQDRKTKVQLLAGKLEGNSPVKRLAAGFSYIEVNGAKVSCASEVQVDDMLHIYLQEGELDAKVVGVTKESTWKKKN